MLFLEVLKFLTASVNAIGGLAFSVTVTLLVFWAQSLGAMTCYPSCIIYKIVSIVGMGQVFYC